MAQKLQKSLDYKTKFISYSIESYSNRQRVSMSTRVSHIACLLPSLQDK